MQFRSLSNYKSHKRLAGSSISKLGKLGRYVVSSARDADAVKPATPELLTHCLKGGYPEPFGKRDNDFFYEQWMESYIQSYIDRDIRRLFPTLNLEVYQRFIKMLKGHLRDSGLLCYMLNIHSVNDLKSQPNYGRIWEAFVLEQVLKGLQHNLVPHQYFYYRTRRQAEIDLILEGRFGTIPIEVKASSSTPKSQLRALESFVKTNECPLGILINNGDEIFMLSREYYSNSGHIFMTTTFCRNPASSSVPRAFGNRVFARQCLKICHERERI